MALFHADKQDMRVDHGRAVALGMPLVALSGGGLARRFHSWYGRSGRRYVCSVFELSDESAMEAVRHYGDAVVLAVQRDVRGEKSLIAVGETGSFPELFWRGAAFNRLISDGAAEFHVHLMAETAAARHSIIEDILALTR
jgi:hypothetical protein